MVGVAGAHADDEDVTGCCVAHSSHVCHVGRSCQGRGARSRRAAGVRREAGWTYQDVVAADHRRRHGLAPVPPDLDYPAGLAYHLMGFDIAAFTPIFVMSRITGWTAHISEQLAHNALIRPLGVYNGPDQRTVPARTGA
ncbi:citrate/2-methylcitrate synthase [Streptomyces sp. NPDC054995]